MSPLVNAASRLMQHYAKAEADVFIMTVPTPIDSCKRLDLSPLENASATVGRALKAPGDLSSSKGRPLPHRFRQHVCVEQNVHATGQSSHSFERCCWPWRAA